MSNTLAFLKIFVLLGNISLSCDGTPLIGEKVNPAEPNEFPFVVSLGVFAASEQSERYLNHFCGGSLITQRHVLTAEHCVADKKPHDVTVTVGSIDLNEGKMYAVDSWITYDKWLTKRKKVPEFPSNDIAVVTLSKNVTDVVPAVRSNLPETKVYGKKVLVAGWGLIFNDMRTRFLQKVSLRVLTPKKCKRNVLKLFGTEDMMPHNHYCTAAKPPVILGCGDSGGPLILKDTREIVGVNEATCNVKNASTHYHATSIHVKVNYFKEFIDDASKE